ncbi:MAG: hypothetical protein PHS80_00955, partial [Methanothrix sp.]|nr:hypothetical protein [Methanothrix sp.]
MRNDVSLLILLADNYNLATTANHKGTKDAQRDSQRPSSFAILAGPPTVGRAVRARVARLRTGARAGARMEARAHVG